MNFIKGLRKIGKYRIRHEAFEAIGLLILLLSFGFQFFSSDLQSMTEESPIIRINDNILKSSSNDLDIIKYLNSPDVYKDHSLRCIEKRNSELSTWANIKESTKEVESQQNEMICFYLSFYLIGSLMVVIPKLFPKLPFFRKTNY